MGQFIPEVYSVMFLGSLQGIVLGSILLSRKKSRSPANAVMATILFVFSLSICIHSISHITDVPYITANHEFLTIIGLMNLGPLYYNYVKCLTNPGFRIKKFLTYISPLYFGIAALILIYIVGRDPAVRNVVKEIAVAISFVDSAAFIILSVFTLYRYTKQIKDSFSNLEKVHLKWLKFLGSCLVFFLLINMILRFISNREAQGDIIWLISAIIIFLIGYFSLAQSEIFKPASGENLSTDCKKYQKSILTPDIAKLYLQKLTIIMEEKMLYLDSKLTLPYLAKETGIPLHLLSQIINESIGQNFYDYVNSKRIKEACKRLIDPAYRHCNISSIAFEVGFNTLSSFNLSFKRYIGMTPSQYKNKLIQCN